MPQLPSSLLSRCVIPCPIIHLPPCLLVPSSPLSSRPVAAPFLYLLVNLSPPPTATRRIQPPPQTFNKPALISQSLHSGVACARVKQKQNNRQSVHVATYLFCTWKQTIPFFSPQKNQNPSAAAQEPVVDRKNPQIDSVRKSAPR